MLFVESALVAKSSVILDVIPWDDKTDMQEIEAKVRKIDLDGLFWGASKLVHLRYNIHKLQINCIIEDEKISVDVLKELMKTADISVSTYLFYIIF